MLKKETMVIRFETYTDIHINLVGSITCQLIYQIPIENNKAHVV